MKLVIGDGPCCHQIVWSYTLLLFKTSTFSEVLFLPPCLNSIKQNSKFLLVRSNALTLRHSCRLYIE